MDVTVPIWVVVLIIALIVVPVSSLVTSSTATRLNRVHIRTDLVHSSLGAALGRRTTVTRTAYSEFASIVTKVETTPLRVNNTGQHADAENELARKTVTLYEEQPVDRTMAIEPSDAHIRLELARRFYNDVVTDTKALRARPLMRTL